MTPSATSDAWTIGRLLRWTTEWLEKHGIDQPRLSAELLVAHAFGCKKIELYTRFELVAGPEPLATLRELVRRAAEHAPIAYLIGRKEFFSLAFEVTPAVLIPRPETETLVQKAIDLCRAAGEAAEGPRVLDVGTGSGCIAVSIAKYMASAKVTATDVSDEALAVARRNADRHAVSERIVFARADGLNLDATLVPAGGFDLLVSNPPYVAEADVDALPRTVRDYEPRLALTAGGSDGLGFYRRFAADADRVLRCGGDLLVEIGAGQLESVLKIFDAAGRFIHVDTLRDPTDPHDRVVHLRCGAPD